MSETMRAHDPPPLIVKTVEAHVNEVRRAMADPANGWTRREQQSGARALELLMRRLGQSQTELVMVPLEMLETAATSVRVSLFLIKELVLNAQPDTVQRLKQAQAVLAPYEKGRAAPGGETARRQLATQNGGSPCASTS